MLVLSADIDRAREFYERALGLRAGDRPPLQFAGYWLYAGRPRACTSPIATPTARTRARSVSTSPPAAAGRGPVDHIAFSAGDYDAVQRAPHGARSAADPQRRAGRWPAPAVLR